MLDRIVSILSYCTMGIFSLIWLVFSYLTKRRISPFLAFNMYQAIFISMILCIFSYVYNIGFNLLSVIPIVGELIESFNNYIKQPSNGGFSIVQILFIALLAYLSLPTLLGKKPRVPWVSEMVSSNFGV